MASFTQRRADLLADILHECAQRVTVVEGVLEAALTVIVTPPAPLLLPLELRRDAHLLIVVDFT